MAQQPIPLTAMVVQAGGAREGDVLGTYQLVKLLGEGAMGQVFQARHTLLERNVAIKVLRPEQYKSPDLIQRFFQEARNVNQINHEHIVEIFDFVQETGPQGLLSVYCVMELLRGESLSSILERGAVPLKRGLNIVRQLCDALHAAHKVGVVHRDVKPDNIFITEKGGQKDYVKVLDFGVAKLTVPGGDAPSVTTMDGAIIGTPSFMAPEQAAGLAVDPRTDIWAVGVLLYQLLAGKLPFEGVSFALLAVQIITKPPPPLPPQTPSGERIPASLSALVMRCLEKEPAKRPPSLADVGAALSAIASHEPQTDILPRQPVPSQFVRSGGRAAMFGALGSFALVVAAGGAWWMFGREKPAPTPPPPLVEKAPTPPPPDPTPPPVDPTPPTPTNTVEPPKPVVAQRPPGPLTGREIEQVISRAKNNLSRCFERHRAQIANAQGTVDIRITIEPAGGVSKARIATDGFDGTPLSGCVVKETTALRFPKHTGPVITINVPFEYRVGG
jgi:serine/threonine-protein kinase